MQINTTLWALAVAISVALPAVAAEPDKTITALSEVEDVAAAVRALAPVWNTWPTIEGVPTALRIRTGDGKMWKLADVKTFHSDTPYGHVDVAEGYSFGQERYNFVQIAFSETRMVVAIRAEDGTLLVPRGFKFSFTVDAKSGNVESYTFAYELADGKTGTRTFGTPSK